jgi:iron complex outermembrane receptor protein
VAQVQHGFDLADGVQDFTYGFDYIATRPTTEGNINGEYELDDHMNEWGVYLQSKTALSDQVDFIAAGRFDRHSVLAGDEGTFDNMVFSPRAALVFRPVPEQSLRLSYNQAYSAPSSLNYFLDISNGFAPGLSSLGIGLRAFGTGRDGWSLQNADGSLKGFTSPFTPEQLGGRTALMEMALATQYWGAAIQVLQAQVAAGALPASLGPLLPVLAGLSPTAGDIGTMLYHPIDETLVPSDQANLAAVPSIKESNTETFEVGWTGVMNDRVKITADVYYTKKNEFVSPLLVQTPLVTFNGEDVGAYIAQPLIQAVAQQYIAAGMDQQSAFAQAQADILPILPALAGGIASVPIGVVGSDQLSGGSELIVTYRNVGDLTLWGSDFAIQWFLDDNWTLNGTYSYVSDDLFPIKGDDDEPLAPIALNAPMHKGSFALAFRDVAQGFNAEARIRFNSEFPAISAGFEGDVPSSQIVDLGLGYKVPNTSATLQLSVSNIFDTAYQSFVGVPEIGRFAMLRVKYDLF